MGQPGGTPRVVREGRGTEPFRVPYGLVAGPFVGGVALALFVGYVVGSPPLVTWAVIGFGFGAFGSLYAVMRALRKHAAGPDDHGSGSAADDEDEFSG